MHIYDLERCAHIGLDQIDGKAQTEPVQINAFDPYFDTALDSAQLHAVDLGGGPREASLIDALYKDSGWLVGMYTASVIANLTKEQIFTIDHVATLKRCSQEMLRVTRVSDSYKNGLFNGIESMIGQGIPPFSIGKSVGQDVEFIWGDSIDALLTHAPPAKGCMAMNVASQYDPNVNAATFFLNRFIGVLGLRIMIGHLGSLSKST